MSRVSVNLLIEVDGKIYKSSSGFLTTGLTNKQIVNEAVYNAAKAVSQMIADGIKVETYMIPDPEQIRDANETVGG